MTASRIATVIVTLASAIVTCYMTSIAGAWRFLMAIGAGAGLVFILRWFWWRINAWSEISALSAAAVFSTLLQSRLAMPVIGMLHRIDPTLQLAPLDSSQPHGFAWLMLVTTLLTTITWLSVTFLTAPEPPEKLQAFYDHVRPAALGWKPFAPAAALREKTLGINFLHWLLGFSLIYAVLFGTGNLLFGHIGLGTGQIAFGCACGAVLFWNLNRLNWTVFK